MGDIHSQYSFDFVDGSRAIQGNPEAFIKAYESSAVDAARTHIAAVCSNPWRGKIGSYSERNSLSFGEVVAALGDRDAHDLLQDLEAAQCAYYLITNVNLCQ